MSRHSAGAPLWRRPAISGVTKNGFTFGCFFGLLRLCILLAERLTARAAAMSAHRKQWMPLFKLASRCWHNGQKRAGMMISELDSFNNVMEGALMTGDDNEMTPVSFNPAEDGYSTTEA